MRRTFEVDTLRDARRRWKPAAVTFLLGVGALTLGALFMRATAPEYRYRPGLEAAGLFLLPIGALTMLVSGPLLGVRASRSRRLVRAERALHAAMREPVAQGLQ